MQLTKKRIFASWFMDDEEEVKKTNITQVTHIPIHAITPNRYQPRRDFNPESLNELAESIKKYGVLQPVTVRQLFSGDYELITGERRLRACSLAGMLKIPAIVVNLNDNDSAIVAIIENIQRENLSFIEEAQAYRNLLFHHGLTQEELAASLGKTQSFVANKVRLLNLGRHVREIISENSLSERHARALLRLSDEDEQIKALEQIIDSGLNAAQTDELINSILEEKKPCRRKNPVSFLKTDALKDMRLFSNTIRHAVDLMNRHGIDAISKKTEFDDYIEYTVIISKESKNEKIS